MGDNLLVTCVDKPPGYSLAKIAVASGLFGSVFGTTRLPSNGLIRRSRVLRDVAATGLPSVGRGDLSMEAAEQAYLEAVERLIREWDISAVLPTNDEEIYCLAKNRERLADSSVSVLTNSWETIRRALDKFTVNRAAWRVGFPAPRCVTFSNDIDTSEIQLPAIVKANRSYSSEGVRKVDSIEALQTAGRMLVEKYGGCYVEEYIEGNREISINLIRNTQGALACCFGLKKFHYIHPSWSTAAQIIQLDAEVIRSAELLVAELGLVGPTVIQTKIDRRNGEMKLVEVNARFGQISRVLLRAVPGLGEAALLAYVGMSEAKTIAVPYEKTMVMLPDDLVAFVMFIWHRLTHESDADNRPPGLREMLHSYIAIYRRAPVVDDFAAAFKSDPSFIVGLLVMLSGDRGGMPSDWKKLVPWGEVTSP